MRYFGIVLGVLWVKKVTQKGKIIVPNRTEINRNWPALTEPGVTETEPAIYKNRLTGTGTEPDLISRTGPPLRRTSAGLPQGFRMLPQGFRRASAGLPQGFRRASACFRMLPHASACGNFRKASAGFCMLPHFLQISCGNMRKLPQDLASFHPSCWKSRDPY